MKNIIKLKEIITEAKNSGIEIKKETNDALDTLMIVQAQAFETPMPKRVRLPRSDMTRLLAYMKLNVDYMQHAHWIAKGDPAYGDHLLFERIYGELTEMMDDYAEKAIGLAGEAVADPIELSEIVAEKMPTVVKFKPKSGNKSLAKYALNSTRLVAKEIEELYEFLKQDDNLTLGLDDMLMSMHSVLEKHLYLLQQRLK